MQFSDLYKSPRSPLSKLRHAAAAPAPLAVNAPDYDPDLYSKDKTRQKEAVKRHIQEKVRNDWDFVWPPAPKPAAPADDVSPIPAAATPAAAQNGHASHDPVTEAVTEHDAATEPPGNELTTAPTVDDTVASTDDDSEDDSDAQSVYSSMSEDPVHFKPRLEWLSDLSDDEVPQPIMSPFRFDTPDAIGIFVRQSAAEKQAKRRRAVREEAEWNEGLACYEARRNAWTGAKTVRVRPKPSSPSLSLASLSPKRLFSRNSVSGGATAPLQQTKSHDQSAATTGSDGSETQKDSPAVLTTQRSKESTRSAASGTSTKPHRIDTLVPVAPPFLPPTNPMRASITPAVYISLYEKVILHNLTPSCPVNLADMIRACVTGWKRDGEWPPRPSAPETLVAVRKKKKPSGAGGQANGHSRRLSIPFIGRDKGEGDDSGGRGLRKSLQRVFGMGGHVQPASQPGPCPPGAIG